MYFIDHQEAPIRFQLVGDSIFMHFGRNLIVRERILKLTRDSLVTRSEEGVMRLRHRH